MPVFSLLLKNVVYWKRKLYMYILICKMYSLHHLRLCNNFLQSAYMYIDTLCYLYTLYEVSIYLYFMIYNLIWIFKMGVLSVIFAADENIMCGFLHNALRQCVFFANVSCMINCYIPYTTIFLLELMCILYIQLFVFYDLYLWFIKPNTEESSVIICLEQLRKAWFAHLLVGSLIPWTFATTKILFHILAQKILLPKCYNVL